jgi:hypothetical protein
VLPRGTPQLPPPQRPLPPEPSPSLGGRPPDAQGPPAPTAGALEPACRARGRPAPAREARRRAPASPVGAQRPQPDRPLAAPLLHTHRPLLTLRLVRIRSDVTVRLKSVRSGCALQKSDVSARAPHNRPTRRCTFHLPGGTPPLSHPGEPAQPAYPANGSSGHLHPAPAHLTYPSERPSQPPVAPSEASMAGQHNSPTRQGCSSRHRGQQASACQPHPAPPSAGAPTGRPEARDPPAPCPLATSRLPGKQGAETIWHPLQHPGTSPQVNGRCKIYRSRPRPLTLSRS